MTDCRFTCDRLTEYVDDMLDADIRTQVARHLERCGSCRREEAAQRGGATVLRRRAEVLLGGPLPPGLRSRCEAELVPARAPARAARRWLGVLVPSAVAAILIVATAFALLRVATAQSNTVLAAELTADHVKCFGLYASGTARSADPVLLEAMLRDRYGWDVDVPASSTAEDLRLDGARRCLYADGPIPHVMYQAHGQNVSLFILEGVERRSADVTTLGHRARIWSRGGNTYVLVSSTAAGTLTDVVGYVQREVR